MTVQRMPSFIYAWHAVLKLIWLSRRMPDCVNIAWILCRDVSAISRMLFEFITINDNAMSNISMIKLRRYIYIYPSLYESI